MRNGKLPNLAVGEGAKEVPFDLFGGTTIFAKKQWCMGSGGSELVFSSSNCYIESNFS
ncbi:hypothetical protein [Candidatus Hakubella thermalkaliphila]|uniref:hypothetical protein n=1 Tax=Candidatus Hakubella thermalkaliphila TaxID=2754717 RepID=UPI00159408E1|nr:hypothetical protein [Candidatus Hakubella thermalkaliphila]